MRAHGVKVGDWVHVRGRITNRWQSGHACIDLDDMRSKRSEPDVDADPDLEAWVDRPTIHLHRIACDFPDLKRIGTHTG
jgi:hypothetical protein